MKCQYEIDSMHFCQRAADYACFTRNPEVYSPENADIFLCQKHYAENRRTKKIDIKLATCRTE